MFVTRCQKVSALPAAKTKDPLTLRYGAFITKMRAKKGRFIQELQHGGIYSKWLEQQSSLD